MGEEEVGEEEGEEEEVEEEEKVDLIGHIKFLPWGQLNGCSVTRPSLRRVWLARLQFEMVM